MTHRISPLYLALALTIGALAALNAVNHDPTRGSVLSVAEGAGGGLQPTADALGTGELASLDLLDSSGTVSVRQLDDPGEQPSRIDRLEQLREGDLAVVNLGSVDLVLQPDTPLEVMRVLSDEAVLRQSALKPYTSSGLELTWRRPEKRPRLKDRVLTVRAPLTHRFVPQEA